MPESLKPGTQQISTSEDGIIWSGWETFEGTKYRHSPFIKVRIWNRWGWQTLPVTIWGWLDEEVGDTRT